MKKTIRNKKQSEIKIKNKTKTIKNKKNNQK